MCFFFRNIFFTWQQLSNFTYTRPWHLMRLLYLTSRGLAPEEAVSLVINGFCQDFCFLHGQTHHGKLLGKSSVLVFIAHRMCLTSCRWNLRQRHWFGVLKCLMVPEKCFLRLRSCYRSSSKVQLDSPWPSQKALELSNTFRNGRYAAMIFSNQ